MIDIDYEKIIETFDAGLSLGDDEIYFDYKGEVKAEDAIIFFDKVSRWRKYILRRVDISPLYELFIWTDDRGWIKFDSITLQNANHKLTEVQIKIADTTEHLSKVPNDIDAQKTLEKYKVEEKQLKEYMVKAMKLYENIKKTKNLM